MRIFARIVVIAATIYFGAHLAIATGSIIVVLSVIVLAFLVDSVLARSAR